MDTLDIQLKLPDLWQQQAIRALQAGKDVIVHAPTGAGKTYIFELLLEHGLKSNAVYTVPTRALANDKLLEWQRRGWNVGIATGDISENTDAPVVVATLEAQKNRLIQGKGPGVLVIDEYQMLGDDSRGVNYEFVISLAPKTTQLLLLSGSVGNPESVRDWFRKIGRDVELVRHIERPVPLEEVNVEALPNRIPNSVQGAWPRAIARALKAGMAPLLTFAPRRRAAETLAYQLARMLPEEDPLELTPEQKRLAGDSLGKLLRARVAFHHSGLDYRQRAGLVEPLAKAGQLRVVVATMGLAAGINFSMRSVLVTDREFRSGERTHLVRPDELLQMFGRAGRRGLDKKGYILIAPGKPRLSEARPLLLKRTNQVDWPSILRVMQRAHDEGRDVEKAARELSERLFSRQRVPLGLREFRRRAAPPTQSTAQQRVQSVVEILTPAGIWERKRAARRIPMHKTLIFRDNEWVPALSESASLDDLRIGTLFRYEDNDERRYGREVALARLGRDANEGELVLTRWAASQLRDYRQKRGIRRHVSRKGWTLEGLQRTFEPIFPYISHGGNAIRWREQNDIFYALLDYTNAEVLAPVDASGNGLLRAPERERALEFHLPYEDSAADESSGPPRVQTPAEAWYQLGLIDADAIPTRRGRIFSFFNHGEGLAIAAALEDPIYPIEELVIDLANLRAGHRFSEHEEHSGRLGSVCQAAYRGASFPGYLNKGVPTDYGDGAAEILQKLRSASARRSSLLSEELLSGDVERAYLEWKSLLTHILHAPDLEWDRWLDLKAEAHRIASQLPQTHPFHDLPPLTSAQRQRHKSFLRFD